jgi:hypothetical protein
MAHTIFPKGAVQTTNTTARSFSNSSAVYLLNNTASTVVTIFRNDANGVLIGSLVFAAGQSIIIEKNFTDTINTSANVAITPVGLTN